MGAVNTTVTWKVALEPATGGTVDRTDLYTTPSAAQSTYTIIATREANLTKPGNAHSVVSPPANIGPMPSCRPSWLLG
jgi:hypothetical protein